MDWAVGLAFPCQQPMLHANGVTEVPKFRITPDYTAKKQDTDTWEDGLNGGLLGISDLLLRAHVMSTYLSHDWGRDWGSLRQFETVVDAQPRGHRPGHRDAVGPVEPGLDPHRTVGGRTAGTSVHSCAPARPATHTAAPSAPHSNTSVHSCAPVRPAMHTAAPSAPGRRHEP